MTSNARDNIPNHSRTFLPPARERRSRSVGQPSGCLFVALLWLCAFAPGAAAETPDQVRPWRDYRTIMWIGDSASKDPSKLPLFVQRLKDMGINTGMIYGQASPSRFAELKFPYYVENIVNRGLCLKWSSKVTEWDKFVTQWVKEGRPQSALVRDYCLDDPEWRSWARQQMQAAATRNKEHTPVCYDIRDELSTTISANPFDYDFGTPALEGFRSWLKTHYADLRALNEEWETSFPAWEEVRPFTTDQIKNRMASGQAQPQGKPDWGDVQNVKFDPDPARKNKTKWNFAPWADFRTYMDFSLARTLNDLRTAAHEVDRATPVGIEGTQMPHAFGGYDLWRLAQAIDWVEPYDIGNAREIFGSFMPGKTVLSTLFEKDTDHAARRLWHLLLEGDRGCIVWWSEDCFDWKSPDYQLTSKARALAPAMKEMTSPLARIFLRAERERDPVFIHYSQPSIQVDWLIESTVDGSTWLRRFSSYEADHNRMARTRNGWLKAVQDVGFTPQFVSSEQLERGELPSQGNWALVMANSRALSQKEADAVRGGLAAGAAKENSRTLICEGLPGTFDEHGKLRNRSPLEDLGRLSDTDAWVATKPGQFSPAPQTGAEYAAARLGQTPNPKSTLSGWLAAQLGSLKPPVTVEPAACVRIHRFRSGQHRLLAFERNINYQMSEDLKQAGGNEPLEKAVEVEARLGARAHIYDLRTQKYLGHVDRFRFVVDPWRPSLFVVASAEIRGDIVQGMGGSND